VSRKQPPENREVQPALVDAVGRELCRLAREWQPAAAGSPSIESIRALYERVADGARIAFGDQSPYVLCARAVRKLVVEHMRRTGTDGGPLAEQVLDVDAALGAVERTNSRLARVIECRYFARMSEEDTARALGLEIPGASREWRRARAWLLRELANGRLARDEALPSVPNSTWVDAVFGDALALSADRREAFLERCAKAPGNLRGYVEELLALAADSSALVAPDTLTPDVLWSILSSTERPASGDEHPLLEPVALPRLRETPGAWRIVKELRSGRLGPLYLAERVGTRGAQKGALRFVPKTTAGSLAALRARPDYRALASLRHEGIARLLDSGESEDGRLFIVSEYVDGRPIDRYCDDERLSIGERLELFSKVCAAVQYAHRHMAVHAALEPSNVVVTSTGEVKLLEFGIAGLVLPPVVDGETSLESIPSLDFASPEQVRGEPVAVASDVYQLGLLLYLLLTGEPGQRVSQPGRPALDHVVCRMSPLLPSARAGMADEKVALDRRIRRGALARALRGDLDAIVMYALRKEPERRYPSVSLLRSDIDRYRRHLPIWAQRDTYWYRLRKFAVRRRAAIAAGLVLALVGAATIPERIAERARWTRENSRAGEVEQVLARIFGSTERAAAGEIPNALQYVEQAVSIARTQLVGEAKSQSRLFTAIGRAYTALGQYPRAIDILEEALTLRRGAFGGDSLEVADTLEALGDARYQYGRYDEAETNFRTALAVRSVREGRRTPAALAASIGLGDVLHARGQFEAAETILRDTLAMLRSGSGESLAPSVSGLLPRALLGLANVLRDRGVLGESFTLYGQGIELLRSAGQDRALQVAVAQADFARLLILRSDLERAEFELAQAISTFRRQAPQHLALGAALRDQAWLRMEQGRLSDAQVLLGEAEQLHQQLLGGVNPSVPRIRAVQAELARRRGDLPQAVAVATEALEGLERLNMVDHPATVDIRTTLAQSLLEQGEFRQAARILGHALTVAERAYVSYDPRIARLQNALRTAAGNRTTRAVRTALTGSTP
jgi:serine/threonine protein kinase